jgi:hypothetical protein
VIRRAPNLAWVWALYADALDHARAHADAERAASESLRLHAYGRLGGAPIARAWIARHDTERARRVLLHALSVHPYDDRARAMLDAL